ncbi:MAG: transposase, partial [Chloroflexi bacterium]|nr:transposase [Chloroflexota bacterium]
MAPADSLARLRKALIDRAERKEAPVTQLCAEAGISRSRFYELRARYRAYGEAGLRPKPRPTERPSRQLPEPLVDAIVAYAVEHPTHGQRTIADALARERFGGWTVSHGGVANVLRRAGLGRRLARLAAAESLAASEGGPLTERILREVRAIERAATRHIGSDAPGEELFFDTFYVGRLKGVGKVWQFSAVDGASSFGIARVLAGAKTAAAMARFLVEDVLPAIRRAGLRLVTATTDNGPEFARRFAEACLAAGVHHHRIPPRSPNLNAFVERFQGTVLHLHYRVAFRYRYYTAIETI